MQVANTLAEGAAPQLKYEVTKVPTEAFAVPVTFCSVNLTMTTSEFLCLRYVAGVRETKDVL